MERCLRNALKAAAPVGSTSAWAEVTASGAGRLYAEQDFVRSAALGCIKVPSGASKSEIPADYRRWDDVLRALKLNPVTDATTDGPDEAARIANNEILGYLAGIPYDHDDRTPPDLSRYGRFVVGCGGSRPW